MDAPLPNDEKLVPACNPNFRLGLVLNVFNNSLEPKN
jgi:hypothetical protein